MYLKCTQDQSHYYPKQLTKPLETTGEPRHGTMDYPLGNPEYLPVALLVG